MPFSIDLTLPTEMPFLFDGWIEHAFDDYGITGNAFAMGMVGGELGTLVTNASMLLMDRMPIKHGDMIEPGELMVRAGIDGDLIPYGQPNCLFFTNVRPMVATSEIELNF